MFGESFSKIQKLLQNSGIKRNAVQVRERYLILTRGSQLNSGEFTQEQIEQLLALRKEGKSLRQIGKEMCISTKRARRKYIELTTNKIQIDKRKRKNSKPKELFDTQVIKKERKSKKKDDNSDPSKPELFDTLVIKKERKSKKSDDNSDPNHPESSKVSKRKTPQRQKTPEQD